MDTIIALPAFTDNYIWLIPNWTDNSAICVDPGEAKPVIDYLTKHALKLDTVLITHHHFDHINGVDDLKRYYPNLSIYGPYDSRIPQITHPLKQGDKFKLKNFTFKILEIPGHTSTHIGYIELQNQWLFCGDTLFSAGCGRVFDGTMEQLYHSLNTLKALPESMQVYCAHEYTAKNLRFAATLEPDNIDITTALKNITTNQGKCTLPSTVALEKKINPFFRLEHLSLPKNSAMKTNDSLKRFKFVRELKDNY